MPRRPNNVWLAARAMKRPHAKEAIQPAARPVVAYSPKTSPSFPAGVTRARKDRDAACAGPTNAARTRPAAQNMGVPRSTKKKTESVQATRPKTDTTMTFLGPKRSSSLPARMVATPATILSAIPKMTRSVKVKPKTILAITDPKTKTAESPSR